jgi:glycine betaine catabolism B
MLDLIDDFLNKITMYRLLLYFLTLLIGLAFVFSIFGVMPFTPVALFFSAFFITLVCWIVNTIFAWGFKAPTNVESVYITAFILVLIITPLKSAMDWQYFAFVGWASIWAMGSKYILAINKKHIFNPAAFAVALTALTINQAASWWVGTAYMMPAVLIGGILIVRKIRRWDLVYSFFAVSLAVILGTSVLKGESLALTINRIFLDSPILFFAFVMLTEPLTTPPTQGLQVIYGAIVGYLFVPTTHVGSFYFTPELALVAGNIYSYLVSPKQKLILGLKARVKAAADTFDFVFNPVKKFSFAPGQYLEWTLGHDSPDSRGNRRYFTIASSPTEENLIIGVKFYTSASSYKSSMGKMKEGDIIVASQLAGDFTLPKDPNKKLAFIAGGIGITPFRSMIKYLVDRNEKRDVVLFYSNKTAADIAYKQIFDEAERRMGIKTIYNLTDQKNIPAGWSGSTGYIDGRMISEQLPDFKQRTFYLSGPRTMVEAFEKTLSGLGVHHSQIKTDFFPGFA